MSEKEQPSNPNDTSSPIDDLTAKREQSKIKTLDRIEQERREMDSVPRYGFFSIPFPQTVGDQAYSSNVEYKHKVIDRKVITEKRGIYVQSPRKGKGKDVYFSPVDDLTEDQLNEIKAKNKEDEDKYLKKVQERKEKKSTGPSFRYPGPQEMFGFYKGEESSVPDKPLYKEKNKFRFIQDRKVITEKRGIFTNPTKLGTNLTPNDYFSFYQTDNTIQEKIKQKAEDEQKQKDKEREERKNPKNFKKPFVPASLKKCDCFASDSLTYGINPLIQSQRLEEYRESKKKGREKYIETLPPGSVKHLKAFSPPKLISTGRNGLFDDNLYAIPEIKTEEKKMTLQERLENEQKNKKKPFTYNRLMNSSSFAPAISNYKVNIKRDFPSIRFC